ncbi:hypothetical protein P7H15_00330 [Paenibacillus larvae]|nr:hypothetical protein [Paenibacillus larvae]MDT2291686.1 hypothetical protein [Paenibacillus larvae]
MAAAILCGAMIKPEIAIRTKFKNKNTGEDVFQVKFVLDREALFSSEEAPSYLRGTVDEWEEMIEGQNNDD